MKFESVAPLYPLFLNKLKSTSGFSVLNSRRTKNIPAIKNIPNNDRMTGDNNPRSDACVTITLTLNNVITNKIKPITSNFEPLLSVSVSGSFFVSGVCLIKKNESIDKAIEIIKIHCHPIVEAINPPNNEHIPLPPHEPIDQKLNARCLSFPM